MKILFTVFHPAHAHVAKCIAKNLQSEGHDILFVIFEKENIIELILEKEELNYRVVGHPKYGIINKLKQFVGLFKSLYSIAKMFEPDIIFSPTSPYSSFLSGILKKPLICWADTETATTNLKVSMPFINSLFLSDTFLLDVKKYHSKIVFFSGYKELAYLHPNRFQPNKNVLRKVGTGDNDKIVLMRFSALKATHDKGLESIAEKKETLKHYIKELEKHAKLYISMSEKDIGPDFEKNRLDIHPSEYHDLLSFCTLYIGEGTTTASEAGVLGVPWIALRPNPLGSLVDQEKKYELGFRTEDINVAFETALNWIKKDNLLDKWQEKREKLLSDKIDVSAFFTWFIENYPESHQIMIDNPDYQERFK